MVGNRVPLTKRKKFSQDGEAMTTTASKTFRNVPTEKSCHVALASALYVEAHIHYTR